MGFNVTRQSKTFSYEGSFAQTGGQAGRRCKPISISYILVVEDVKRHIEPDTRQMHTEADWAPTGECLTVPALKPIVAYGGETTMFAIFWK